MKTIIKLLALAILAVPAQAAPPWGIYQQQDDGNGVGNFNGYYIVPPNQSGAYIWMYDGSAGVPANNPMKMAAIGSGLNWNGTTLSATGSGVTSVICGTGLTGGTITSTGTCAMASVGTAGTYSSGVTTDAQGRVTAGVNRAFNYTTKTLNSCFQLSATRDSVVTYPVEIGTSLSLTGGTQGTVYLRTYTNSGCSTGTQEVMRATNANTGTLTVGLALNQTVMGILTGLIPAGTWAQLVTENNTGTPTFTSRPGQEVVL